MRRMILLLVALVVLNSAPVLAEPLLLVMNKHEDTLTLIDPQTLKPVQTITVGRNPHEMVITPDGRYLYASNYDPPGDTVSVVDLIQRRHVLQIPTGRYTRIHSAAISPDGQHVYFTAGQSGYVVEIDTRTNQIVRGIPTHGKISHMVEVSPDGKRLYTANIETQNVSVIDRASGELITQIPCDKGCEGIQFTPDGRELWAANYDAGNITIIDVATHQVTQTLDCPGMPLRIRFTRDGRRALVSNWVREGEVVVFDVAERREIKRLRVGNQPIGIQITPDQKRAFVTSMTSDEVHVIDLESLTVTDRFVAGQGPDALAWWLPPESAAVRPPEPVRLFNGRNLDGFYTYLRGRGRNQDPKQVFTVADGTIRISGEEWGYLMTEEDYEDYHLIAEFKWGEQTFPPREHEARDSGILVHSAGQDGAYSGLWMYSLEVQIIEGGTGDFIVVGDGTDAWRLSAQAEQIDRQHYWKPGGKPVTLSGKGRLNWFGRDPAWEDVKGFRGARDVEKPVGEWNRLECAVVGDTISVTLNGVLVNRCFAAWPRKGRIQIQSEGAEIFFRRLDLVPLGSPGEAEKKE